MITANFEQIRHHLRERGVDTADNCVIDSEGVVTLDGRLFANYKYFAGIDQPLFRFQDPRYNKPKPVIQDDKVVGMKFHLSLSPHNTAGLLVYGWEATSQLRACIMRMFTNYTNDPCYELKVNSAAFFQGGSQDIADSEYGFLYVEFWKPEGAQAFIDHLSEIYQPNISDNSE